MGKNAFFTTKMSFQQSGTKSIFQKRLTHDFLQKFEISCLSDFPWKRPGHDV